MLIKNQPESHLRSRRAYRVPPRTPSRFSATTIVTSCAVWLNVVRLCLKGERSFNTIESDKTCGVHDPGLPVRLLRTPNNTLRNSMTVVRAGNPSEMVTCVECGPRPMRRRHRTLPLSFPSLAFLSWGPRLSPHRIRWALTPQESFRRSPHVRTSHHRGCSLPRGSMHNRRSLVQVVPSHLRGARMGVRGAHQKGRGWLKKLSAGIVLA